MKKVILQFLVITLISQSYVFQAHAQVAQANSVKTNTIQVGGVEIETSDEVIEEETLNPKNESDAALIKEAAEKGISVDQLLEQRFGQFITTEKEKIDLGFTTGTNSDSVEQDGIKNIAEPQSIIKLKDEVKRGLDIGKWAMRIVYFPKLAGGTFGEPKALTSYRMNEPIKPASTLKLFTGFTAYKYNSYPLATLKHMLKESDNNQAEDALDSVGKISKLGCVEIPKNGIRELRPCGIEMVKKEIAGLPDANKFNMVNGSGLNKTGLDKGLQLNMVTAQLESAWLSKILNSGKYNDFKWTLAIPGQGVGTLTSRLQQTNKMTKIYAKTGTLDQTISLSGFAETAKGVMVFAILSDELPLKIVVKNIRTRSGKIVKEGFGNAYRRAVLNTQSIAKHTVDDVVFSHSKFLFDGKY